MRVLAFSAIAASVIAGLGTVGFGSFLALVEQSGERTAGSLLAFGGIICFAAALVLAFAPVASFRDAGGRIFAVAATVLAVLPVAALAVIALLFVVNPFGSVIPVLDWAVFLFGLLMLAGALAVVVLGYRRATTGAAPAPVSPAADAAASAARIAAERLREDDARPTGGRLRGAIFETDGDARVTRV